MEIINQLIEDYIDKHSDAEPELLSRLNRQTHLKVLLPRMLSGHYQGRLLSMISKMIRPKYILEIGTYTGYSALCLAEGLREGGKLVTLDVNVELEPMVRAFFEEAGMKDRIEYILGNALDVIPSLTEPFDLVFIDADKKNNLNYYELMLKRMKPGAIILIDNALWSGKVVHAPHDKDTMNIMAFNEHVQQDERVENVLLPVRDGVMMARVKG